ncbi:flagellar hook-length control protein FliK [Paracoccus isoporae]|nr:flagellar hook-length control protein FliK [Paracoccus isoporae]
MAHASPTPDTAPGTGIAFPAPPPTTTVAAVTDADRAQDHAGAAPGAATGPDPRDQADTPAPVIPRDPVLARAASAGTPAKGKETGLPGLAAGDAASAHPREDVPTAPHQGSAGSAMRPADAAHTLNAGPSDAASPSGHPLQSRNWPDRTSTASPPQETLTDTTIPSRAEPPPGLAQTDHARAAPPNPATVQKAPPPAEQLAEMILRASSAGGETELLLAPEELGRLRFAIQQVDGALTISISAERPETLALLRRQSDLLQSELIRSGLEDTTLDFREDRGNRPSQHHPDDMARPAAGEGGATDAAPPTPAIEHPPATPHGPRLNLRV